MSASPVQRFYRYHARIYDATRWTILHGRRRAVSRMELDPQSQVLEVGCGTGLNFGCIVSRLDPAIGRLTGLDFSADMLSRAARRCRRAGWTNVDLVQGDATQMQLGRRFHAILFGYSLTMIPDWGAALRRAWEHLLPGGRLVVLDFGGFDGWGPLGSVMRGWLRASHVETRAPYIEKLREICGAVDVHGWLGGYNFTAVARRP